eukprot:TRINITY_DN10512_c0_g1_i1.p1 TRINITY_DN10512_c0_g1~~TRINITY_DN10512_c0_g1_i1.p1  ORF type:complete len:207 (+),score=60.30 TRINITY_DN10512_c0_g1_i1:79-621(+)
MEPDSEEPPPKRARLRAPRAAVAYMTAARSRKDLSEQTIRKAARMIAESMTHAVDSLAVDGRAKHKKGREDARASCSRAAAAATRVEQLAAKLEACRGELDEVAGAQKQVAADVAELVRESAQLKADTSEKIEAVTERLREDVRKRVADTTAQLHGMKTKAASQCKAAMAVARATAAAAE